MHEREENITSPVRYMQRSGGVSSEEDGSDSEDGMYY